MNMNRKTPAQRKLERLMRDLNNPNPRASTLVAPKLKTKPKVRNKHDRKLRPHEITEIEAAIKANEAKVAAMKPGYSACGPGKIIRVTGRNISGRYNKLAA
jgi:hypothetical protein